MRVGFIGLGLMGTPMARNIMGGGFPLAVWNRTASKGEPLLAAGATWAESVGQLAEQSDVVVTMVTDAAASEKVICGEGGVLDHARPGTVIVDTSSIAPEMSRSIAARTRVRGVCAGHVQQLGGGSPLYNLMEVKYERSARAEPQGTV